AWRAPVLKAALGAVLLFGAVRQAAKGEALWIGWTGMLGIILVLHFGIFELLAAAWRCAGISVKPVMRAPIRATSLREFWGRGWLFTAACTAGPAFWLFHPPFVRNVTLPMLRAFGGN